MRRNYTGSLVVTLLFALAAIYFLYPTFDLYSKDEVQRELALENDPDLRNEVVNLGLDLQGGIRLVLDIDTVGLSADEKVGLMDRAFIAVENRVNTYGLTEASLQMIEQKYQIIVELPGVTDPELASELIQTAKLRFHSLRTEEELVDAIEAIDEEIRGDVLAQVETTDSEVVEALEPIETAEVTIEEVTTDSETEIAVIEEAVTIEETVIPVAEEEVIEDFGFDAELPDFASVDAGLVDESIIQAKLFSEYIQRNGSILYVLDREKSLVKELLEDEAVIAAIRSVSLGSVFAWGNKPVTLQSGESAWMLYFLKSREDMDGENIQRASVSSGNGQDFNNAGFGVSLEFNNHGARDFSRVTRNKVGHPLAIVLDGVVFSAPNINEQISTGSASITGQFTYAEAENLANVLQAGALPADISIGNKKLIGPSLGKESINLAIKASWIGLSLVLIFMVIYYKGSGLLSVTALIMNVVFVLALLAAFGATLTLPGIAGLILTMGMSIDANVIIFERIKEELKLGKGVMSSIEAGYDRAFVTIMDANITTLITAIILYYLGSGPIRGFAITMMFGIIVSLFTALTFTRMVFHYAVGNRNVKKLSI